MTNAEEHRTNVQARRGFFPVVMGHDVSVTQAGMQACLARGDVRLTQGGCQVLATTGDATIREGGCMMLLAGGDVPITEGGSMMLLAGGDVSISEGGAMVAAARRVTADRSFIGVAIGGKVDIADDSKVVLSPRLAAIFGAAAGLACALLSRLLSHKR